MEFLVSLVFASLGFRQTVVSCYLMFSYRNIHLIFPYFILRLRSNMIRWFVYREIYGHLPTRVREISRNCELGLPDGSIRMMNYRKRG